MKIKHVYGNVLRLDIPLTVKIVTSDGGHTQETEEPFYPDTSKPVLVELANKYNTKYTYEATMTENVAHIEDYGDARVGVYKVTVRCYDEQGQPYRYMARDIIDIVDATADAGIEAGIEFDSETYTLEGAYFIKGEKGDTGEGVPSGGTTGQVLKKKSNDDYDTEWSSDNAPVTSVNGKTGDVTLGAEEVGALPADTPIPTVPTEVSSFNNDAGYITKSVNDLVNYYLKSETYTKQEVQGLIAAIQQFHYEIYASTSDVTSPQGNVLYLIGPTGTGSDKYEEYVYDSTKQEPWVKIGDTSIDLSDYYTKGQTNTAITQALNTALADYTTTAALTLLLAGKQDVINDLATIRSGAAAGATAYQKPQVGIPSTDMSQGVQTSLGKADSSLQPSQQTLTEAQKQQARNNIGAAGVDDVPTLPNNVSYFSGDSGDGVVPTDGIRGEDIVASSAISVIPDVVTAITGEIGSATTITLVVPNDSLRHVWDMFFTTASDGGATIVVPQGATLHVPSGYSIASGKTYEVRVIGVGSHYYLSYGEYN